MADIFLSYSRNDRARVERLVTALEARGWAAWWDKDIAGGESWSDVIESELNQARCVVVAWSAHSIKSEWVREEARIANRTRKLVPVLLDPMDPPFGFGGVQTVDLSEWVGDPDASDFARLCTAVQLKLDPARAATKPMAEIALQSVDLPGSSPNSAAVAAKKPGKSTLRIYAAAAAALATLLLSGLGWQYYSSPTTNHLVVVKHAGIGNDDLKALTGRVVVPGWAISIEEKESREASGKNEIRYHDNVLAAEELMERAQAVTSEPIALKKSPELAPDTFELWISKPDAGPESTNAQSAAFNNTAPLLIRRLMADFGFTAFQAAGIVGNIAQETAGFTVMQELKPISGRGGLGYLGWTGPARVAFEKYCEDKGLSPASLEANYGFLKQELETTYARIIPPMRASTSLEEATALFQRQIVRAGIPNVDTRTKWAFKALKAFQGS